MGREEKPSNGRPTDFALVEIDENRKDFLVGEFLKLELVKDVSLDFSYQRSVLKDDKVGGFKRPGKIFTSMSFHESKKFPTRSSLFLHSLLFPVILHSLFPGDCWNISKHQCLLQQFYEYINAANILEAMRQFLVHDDPNVRAKTCSAIGNMCRHSPYFYCLLKAKHHIISAIIDRCGDSDKRTRKFACFAVGNAAYHNDSLYDELRKAIPQLTKLLVFDEEDKTKANAAGALSNLVRNSNRLYEDIITEGAMQALLRVVANCSTVALNPRKDAVNESPLKIALFSLVKMCDHQPCRQYIRSSEYFPLVVQLRQSPEPTIANYATVITTKASES